MTLIKIFGRTRVEQDGVVSTPWVGTKPRQVVELLAVAHPSPLCKSRLIDALWEGSPPLTAASTLESYVCVVRRELEAHGLSRHLLLTGCDGYRLAEHVVVDLAVVRALLLSPRQGSGTAERVGSADRIATAPLLASSASAPWALNAAAATSRLMAEACVAAAEQAHSAGDAAAAVRLATRAADEQPLSERACRALLHAHLAAGDRCQALRVFADFRARVRGELGVEPSARTTQAYLAVLRHGGDEVSVAEREQLGRLLRQAQAVQPGPERAVGRAPAAVHAR